MVSAASLLTRVSPRLAERGTRAQFVPSEIGPLPATWGTARLGDILEFQNGVNADAKAYGSGIPFANVLEVLTHSHLKESHIPGSVKLTQAQVRSYRVRKGDVLFNRTSETQEEVGLASVYADDADVVFGGFVIRGRLTTEDFDPSYCGYAWRHPLVRGQIIARGQGAIRANIGQADLRTVIVPKPPLPEQHRIAEVISDADELIQALESLLAKKRGIKQGAMQELLSGSRRLAGFTGELKGVPISKLAEIRSGGTPSTIRPEFWGGEIPWCTPTDITALSGGKYLTTTARTISAAGLAASSAELIPPGSVIMTSRATIGECAINLTSVTTNQGFKNLIPRVGTDVEFLYYLMSTQRERLIALCGGSTFLEISKSDLSGLEVNVPESEKEQKAIASVLAAMDEELKTLDQKLAKARRIRRGMMQELLTGRIRLI